ncbi:MAG: hypothetical protein Q9197_006762 [Variospora fuerteventurae]
MSVTRTWTAYPSTNEPVVRLRTVHLGKSPLHLLNLPAEIRLEIYSYLLPNLPSYPTGISEPKTAHPASLRSDSKPADPSILFTCRKIYHEATPILYRDRCFHFDIAGHLLRSVTNRHNRVSTVNFRAWLGLSSHFKQHHWPRYDIRGSLDYARVEEVCVTFWPVHGCPSKLDDARQVAVDLCRELRKASALRRVCVRFRDVWPWPKGIAAAMTCRHMTEVEYLLQAFKGLRGVGRVDVELPAFRVSGSEAMVLPQSGFEVESDRRVMQGQMRCVEDIRAVMMKTSVEPLSPPIKSPRQIDAKAVTQVGGRMTSPSPQRSIRRYSFPGIGNRWE